MFFILVIYFILILLPKFYYLEFFCLILVSDVSQDPLSDDVTFY